MKQQFVWSSENDLNYLMNDDKNNLPYNSNTLYLIVLPIIKHIQILLMFEIILSILSTKIY